MKYTEILENKFTDRVDVDLQISLFEYGIVRNPENDQTILKITEKEFLVTDISIGEVKEALERAEKGFFQYIGSDLQTELKRLHNDNLAHIINSINQYESSVFTPYTDQVQSFKSLLRNLNKNCFFKRKV